MPAMGPEKYELRRMPVRRVMYEKYLRWFVDKVNPFEMAKELPNRGWRPAIGIMMGCFAIDLADEQRAAWAALNRARRVPQFPPEVLTQMERLYYGWPMHVLADGRKVEFSETYYPLIEKDIGRWRASERATRARRAYTEFFRRNYERIVEMEKEGK
jgi:hypothetical protein